MQYYRLMGINVEDGYPYEEKNEMTFDEANSEMTRYKELFPDVDYYIEPYEYTEPEPERVYNERAVDGWEDMYPDRDY